MLLSEEDSPTTALPALALFSKHEDTKSNAKNIPPIRHGCLACLHVLGLASCPACVLV